MDFLFLYGTPDDQVCSCWVTEKGKLEFGIPGGSNIYPFLNGLDVKKHRFYLSGTQGNQRYSFSFAPSLVISELSDPDSHVIALTRAVNFCEQQKFPVFNHPRAVQRTRRDLIYDRLKHIDRLTVPKTIRFKASSPDDVRDAITANNLHYPVIFRKAGDHGGKSMTLLEDATQLETAMYSYALDGSFFYATEFHNFKSADGHYRKYRIAVVGGRPHLRHMIVSDSWLIHAVSRKHMSDKPALQKEEEDLLLNFDKTLCPKIIDIVNQITPILDLDYYGIDFSIGANGEMIMFEANPNMNILVNKVAKPNVWEAPIENIVKDISSLMMRKAETKKEVAG